MYVNTVITVYDDGNTNPMVQVHAITTDDDEARKKVKELADGAKKEGWKLSANSSAYQYNLVMGGPRRTLTIKTDISSFSFGLSAIK